VRGAARDGGGAVNCSLERIEAYADHELDAAQQAAVAEHLADCRTCSEAYIRLRRQKAGIEAAAPYYLAPSELKQSVRHELHKMAAEGKPRMAWRWLAIAASVLLAASVTLNVIRLGPRTAESELAENVLSDHIRSLIGTRLVDVASSDQHTVKPWFAGKLDFSPDVKDFEGQGFPLAGGRIEYLEGRRVAALVYHRRQHVINLFIWPGETGSETAFSRNGYHLLHWNTAGMTYWAVSDVSTGELHGFRDLLK
jgi:anti-sigma factor RsiW